MLYLRFGLITASDYFHCHGTLLGGCPNRACTSGTLTLVSAIGGLADAGRAVRMLDEINELLLLPALTVL